MKQKNIDLEFGHVKLGIPKGDPWAWLGGSTSEKRADNTVGRKEGGEGDKYFTILSQAKLGPVQRVGPPVTSNKGIAADDFKKINGVA